MNEKEKEMLLEMYNKYSEQIPSQFSRRQTDNRYFLAICLAIFAGIGWMIENCFLTNYPFSVSAACLLGISICFSWAFTIYLYNKSINSKCTILRGMEKEGGFYALYHKDKLKIYEKKDRIIQPNHCGRRILKVVRHYLPISAFFFAYFIACWRFWPQ
jgi:hypothetical protein